MIIDNEDGMMVRDPGPIKTIVPDRLDALQRQQMQGNVARVSQLA